jgi:multimeric flavodoxin WrbA
MKAVLLDGSRTSNGFGERIRAALTARFQAQGWDVEHIVLREKEIGDCAGDFFCWIRSPGVCNLDDDNREIAAAIINSDLMVYLTPVTFGGYSSVLKGMVDHQLQNSLPLFTKLHNETHHRERYQNNPDLLAVGWIDASDAQTEMVFRHLVQRNALNWRAKTYVSDVVMAGQSHEDLMGLVQSWLTELENGQSSRPVELTDGHVTGNGAVDVRRALLLVGSPKKGKSTSNSLGEYLFDQLDQRSIQTETVFLYNALHSPEKMRALLDAVDTADLVMAAFPLYVDALPGPVVNVLERIAAHRQGRDSSTPQLFTAITNNGFPEVHQCTTALAICEVFAQQAGFEWAGGLALGGGAMIDGAALVRMGGRTKRIRQSLDLAASALAQGQPIPVAAQDSLGKPVIPHWMYRLIGQLRWKSDAKSHGAQKLLKRQPYLAGTE